ncbi:MAG: sugar ABC transporter substrate-binding protein [Actinobacteria bacterium]|nr:sugar ABC transporter substrate-binding protein [Actinomycetota bacterium]
MSVLVAAIALSACGSSGSSSSSSSGSTSASGGGSSEGGKSFSIAYFNPLASNPYIGAFTEGVEKAAEEHGANLTVTDANGDPGQQASQIQTSTGTGNYDGFVIIPITPAAVPAITKAHDQGILTVCAINICGNNPVATTNESPDVITSQLYINIPKQEEMLVEATSKACEGLNPCNVVYIPGNPLDSRTSTRTKLLSEGLAKNPSIKLLSDEQSGESNVAKAQDAASNLLATYPEMNVMVCDSDQCAIGAETALKKAGKLGKIQLIGASGSEEGVEAVKSGAWFADAFPEPINQYGEEITTTLIEALEEKKVPAAIEAKSEPPILYKDNVSEFESSWSAR